MKPRLLQKLPTMQEEELSPLKRALKALNADAGANSPFRKDSSSI